MKVMSTIICILILTAVTLSSSGCSAISGLGMENAQKKNIERENAFHKKICDAMNRV